MPNVSRSYCITWNNPQSLPLLGEGVRYVCWQLELGEQHGTPHLQCYAEFKKPMRIQAAQRALGMPNTAHFELRKGTRLEARAYCGKSETRAEHGDGFQELGIWIGGQGTRNDLEAVVAYVYEGKTLQEVATEYPVEYIKFGRGIERWIGVRTPATARTSCKVFYIWGESGAGKSRAVFELYPEAYWWTKPQNGGSYALGYAGQRVVIFDDFYSWIPYSLFLRVCDKYPLTVNTQGNNVPFNADLIFFTSNRDWTSLYTGGNCSERNEEAIQRRLHHRLHVYIHDHEKIKKWIIDRI